MKHGIKDMLKVDYKVIRISAFIVLILVVIFNAFILGIVVNEYIYNLIFFDSGTIIFMISSTMTIAFAWYILYENIKFIICSKSVFISDKSIKTLLFNRYFHISWKDVTTIKFDYFFMKFETDYGHVMICRSIYMNKNSKKQFRKIVKSNIEKYKITVMECYYLTPIICKGCKNNDRTN